MSRLKELFEELQWKEVETFIASGNVLFSCLGTSESAEQRISAHLHQALGYPVDSFVRTVEQLAVMGRKRMFREEGQDGITVHVAFLHQSLAPETARGLEGVRTDQDEFRVDGREFYWLCRGRTSDSVVWKLPAAKALKLPSCTMRNMTSVRKLIATKL